MRFPLVCCGLAVPRHVLALLKLVNVVRLAFLLTLSLLGLYRCPYTLDDHSSDLDPHRRRSDGGETPQPEVVKERLPAVEFLQLTASASRRGDGKEEEEEEKATCTVCLERVEAKDVVRRLGNCPHAFHVGCIDQWIDLGRVTCPLCRSHLLPCQPGGMLGWARADNLRSRLGRRWEWESELDWNLIGGTDSNN